VSKFTEEDDALLEELGVEIEPEKRSSRTAREERIVAGFEEIQRFVEQRGCAPQHGEDRDIFERLCAVRLDRLRELSDCRALLEPLDHQRLLAGEKPVSVSTADDLDDDELLARLGVEAAAPAETPNSVTFAPPRRSALPKRSLIARNARTSTASSRCLSRCRRNLTPACARPGVSSASPRLRRAVSISWAAKKPMSLRWRSLSPTSTATSTPGFA
jgi:hypothetical protein